ncbi:hypothetical protein [Enhydrobacter sp.]|jgi:aminoglycoside phosphotransferase family enzyme|uniref:hypothetical protein n=1 Tax=Enhydrobacter sp. TaxID=1894999 RepID=UPI00262FDE00|nr:hypothetical protein [Enhydrobacter sp.]WIM11923.1 MAG: hypothetical protein OJF58_002882 [Enhydrobacter sp.]
MDGLTIPISLAHKVAFLSRASAYGLRDEQVECRETHMSWVFLVGQDVYKLKKPVRLAYLDFSSVEKRYHHCLAELTLNRRLAADVYKKIVPITCSGGELAIDGRGEIVDWLVVMCRLDDSQTLERALLERRLTTRQLDPLIEVLARFYRRASSVAPSPDTFLAQWRRSLRENEVVLLDHRLDLAAPVVRRLHQVQRRFLDQRSALLVERCRRIVDGHGDLRPEHIWLGPPVRIIDCLEFNQRLREVDPLDEIAFLSIECARLGGAGYGDYIERRLCMALPDTASDQLFAFYRCYRATLRARLSIAHLLEPSPRTPAKWRRQTGAYLALATANADRLEHMMNRSLAAGGDGTGPRSSHA